jgi:hypothetical protein
MPSSGSFAQLVVSNAMMQEIMRAVDWLDELRVVFQVSQDLSHRSKLSLDLLAAIQVCAITGTNRLPGRVENGEDRAACPDHVIVQQFLMLLR